MCRPSLSCLLLLPASPCILLQWPVATAARWHVQIMMVTVQVRRTLLCVFLRGGRLVYLF